MLKLSYFSFFIILIAGLTACNFTRIKNADDTTGEEQIELSQQEKLSMMNYNFINSRILQPKCVSCHGDSGRVSLETYELVKSHLAKIDSTVFVEKTMPKRGTLTAQEKRLLKNWIKMGAPHESESAPPELEPLTANYDSIRSHIIEPKCITCHSPGNSGKRIPLDKESLLNSPLELVIPENPDESGLIIALERNDDKRMPPKKEGYAPLKKDQIEIIREWITNGAN